MNREIKFRAWSVFTYRMYYPQGSEDMTDKVTSASLLAAYNDGGMDALMQYTGLKDLKGKDIYESDIVYLAGYGDYEVQWPFIELFEAAAEKDIGEIKGNIYENPNLIN